MLDINSVLLIIPLGLLFFTAKTFFKPKELTIEPVLIEQEEPVEPCTMLRMITNSDGSIDFVEEQI